ncbi:MAG: hypothetical protein IKZ87_01900 [Actinomycetaceae bacterium]|nr:hypothetical protein [Actinomycetaceae bacterium]
MFIVSVLVFCIALLFTPFSARQHLSVDPAKSTREKDKAPKLSSFLSQRKSVTKRGGFDVLKNAKKDSVDLGLVVSEVATRLRSGAQVEVAWNESIASSYPHIKAGSMDEHGVPLPLRALRKKPRRFFPEKHSTDQTQLAIPAAIALCRLSHFSGAPIADVLESCAAGITEMAEAASARSVALAGPQTSAQMLAWLPLVGLVLGSALGADPLDFLFGTVIGRLVFTLGVVCEIAGIVWIRRLSANAEKL